MCGYRDIGGTMFDCPTGQCQATMGDWSDKRKDFDIFDTDYDNYEISYSCKNMCWGYFKWEMLSFSTREETMSRETYNKVKDVINMKLPWYHDYLYEYNPIFSGIFSGLKTWTNTQGKDCVYDWVLEPYVPTDMRSVTQDVNKLIKSILGITK